MELPEIILAAYLIIIIFGIVKGVGENRQVVIFKDYDDLGLTFLIPAAFFLIYIVSSRILGPESDIPFVAGFSVSLWLTSKLIKQTYTDNGNNILKTILALATKIPLAIIWVYNLIQILNPSGDSSVQRAKNRGGAMVVLMILTPIVGALIVDKTGSYFNPKSWIKGRRVGAGIRNHI